MKEALITDQWVVLGSSPRLDDTPYKLLTKSNTIALNQAIQHFYGAYMADIHLIWDSHEPSFKQHTDAISLAASRPVQRWYPHDTRMYEFLSSNQGHSTPCRGIVFFERVQTKRDTALETTMSWPPRLNVGGSVATAACHLAALMGAKSIYLCGVDMIGTERFNGEQLNGGDDTTSMIAQMNQFFGKIRCQFRQLKIYKTVEESPLELPYCSLDKWR